METKQWSGLVKRDGWVPGPWDDEPEDKIQWQDKTTGLACLMVRNAMGNWCGYAGVPKDHPWHGKNYNELYDVTSVHGGLTYSATCRRNICHIADPGEPDDIWWLGFDMGHYGDISPGLASRFGPDPGSVYRKIDYVQQQCQNLAKQINKHKLDPVIQPPVSA